MAFKIRLGLPEVEAFWGEMKQKFDRDELNATERKFFNKFVKFYHLS